MGLEERQARPDRQDRRHQQSRPQVQGHRRPAKAAETPRTGPRILRRPAPALYHRINRIGRPTYARLSNWFTECDPRLQVPVWVTLDGGPDPSIRAAAPAIAQRLQEVRQNVFMYNSYSLADDDHLVLWPAPLDGGRLDFPHHRA